MPLTQALALLHLALFNFIPRPWKSSPHCIQHHATQAKTLTTPHEYIHAHIMMPIYNASVCAAPAFIHTTAWCHHGTCHLCTHV